jgi:hypothetical protein
MPTVRASENNAVLCADCVETDLSRYLRTALFIPRDSSLDKVNLRLPAKRIALVLI